MNKFLLLFLVAVSPAFSGSVVWFTGLPCAGKTTIAKQFHEFFPNSVIIDGDVVRKAINTDLGFTKEDRVENLRRVREMAKVCLHSTETVLVSVVSPYQSVRDYAENKLRVQGICLSRYM